MQSNSYGGHSAHHDSGGSPFICNLRRITQANDSFRTAVWTGQHLQMTLMCIPARGEIGLEMHEDVDQLLCLEAGRAMVYLGDSPHCMRRWGSVGCGDAILIPAGTWHNLVNTGSHALKLYSLYAPPQHPFGTVHRTQADAAYGEH